MSSPEIAAEPIADPPPGPADHARFASLPPLARDSAFWGMTVTQFLGAFNDNLFKQLVLLLSIVPVALAHLGEAAPMTAMWLLSGPLVLTAVSPAAAPYALLLTLGAFDPGKLTDKQGLANVVFALPFILTTGYAGYLSDRYGKRGIVVLCKVAEILVMAAGAVGFWLYSRDSSLMFLYVVLFFMGAQSGFFGPAKYGILPEMLRPGDLPRANGIMLTTTFMAIILGQFLAGVLIEDFGDRLWVGSTACVAIAVLGTISSLWVRKLPIANPTLKFELSALTVPTDMRRLLARDRPLLAAVVVSSLFWMLAGMVPAAVNALGIIELYVGPKDTSYLLAVVSVGIALGGGLGGIISGDAINFRVLRIGAVGMLACLTVLAIPSTGGGAGEITFADFVTRPGVGQTRQWLGYYGSGAMLIALGVFTGMFAVPLQVFMQSRPPENCKGRMIAVMNLANWVGIVLSGVLYAQLATLIEARGWPRCTMFAFIALLTLPIAVFYHPKSEALAEL
ncbi:MAG: MFS transporter [Pirellulales bacterium]|nr:MFS transporter [Pirellulales bacterium]